MASYYNLSPEHAIDELETSVSGLDVDAIPSRQQKHGKNIIEKESHVTKLSIFIDQFKDVLTFILVFAAVVSAALGDISDTLLIAVIIIGNALLGFIQEYKAEQSIESLREYLAPQTTVVRSGKKMRIDAADLVPGDIIVLEAGDSVPADARILSASDLSVDESMLTGESLPVEKHMRAIDGEQILADQLNMVFMGTDVIRGSCMAVVTGIGMGTQIGSIAQLIEEGEQTYFQKKLDALGKSLGKAVVLIALVVFALGLLDNEPILDMVLISLSLAVAAIPEGLPAVVTITLSLGVRRMAAQNAIVKRLPAAETLGSCNVICSDKTGTITQNKMTVQKVFTLDSESSVEAADKASISTVKAFEAGAICNTASLDAQTGDPTELALLNSAKDAGVDASCETVRINPFDSERKRMSVACREGEGYVVYCKGAVEQVLGVCDRIYDGETLRLITPEDRELILEKMNEYASQALRVLALAFKESDTLGNEESGLVFVGMQAMIDPPKDGVRASIEKCVRAGIKVIMITGDHALTAQAIGAQVGLFHDGDKVLTGKELEGLSADELSEIADDVTVYARVNPEHKLKIVEALREKGHVIAMTGDGVNDAPALKSSDIGVAMNSGTDVSKESADMILLDDNFTTIVSSVEEGRHIFDNIRKFVRYLLATNFGEVFTIFLASIVGFPLPLVAVQILWINLLTDGLPALSLAFEPKEKAIMDNPPHKSKENIVDRAMSINIIYTGLIMAFGTLYLYSLVPEEKGMTIAFTTLVLFQLFNVFNCRSFNGSIFTRVQNKLLVGAVVLSFVLQLAVIYIAPLSKVFYTVALNATDWMEMAAVALTLVVFEEVRKLFSRRHAQQ